MPLALGQVQEIVDYIKRDKPEAAGRWADGVSDLVDEWIRTGYLSSRRSETKPVGVLAWPHQLEVAPRG